MSKDAKGHGSESRGGSGDPQTMARFQARLGSFNRDGTPIPGYGGVNQGGIPAHQTGVEAATSRVYDPSNTKMAEAAKSVPGDRVPVFDNSGKLQGHLSKTSTSVGASRMLGGASAEYANRIGRPAWHEKNSRLK